MAFSSNRRFSGRAAPSLNRPDRFKATAPYQMITVVKIDRRIAMRDCACHDVARMEPAFLWRVQNAALFVAEEEIARASGRAAHDLWRAGVGGKCLETRVGRRYAIAIGAYHCRLYEQRGFER